MILINVEILKKTGHKTALSMCDKNIIYTSDSSIIKQLKVKGSPVFNDWCDLIGHGLEQRALQRKQGLLTNRYELNSVLVGGKHHDCAVTQYDENSKFALINTSHSRTIEKFYYFNGVEGFGIEKNNYVTNQKAYMYGMRVDDKYNIFRSPFFGPQNLEEKNLDCIEDTAMLLQASGMSFGRYTPILQDGRLQEEFITEFESFTKFLPNAASDEISVLCRITALIALKHLDSNVFCQLSSVNSPILNIKTNREIIEEYATNSLTFSNSVIYKKTQANGLSGLLDLQ